MAPLISSYETPITFSSTSHLSLPTTWEKSQHHPTTSLQMACQELPAEKDAAPLTTAPQTRWSPAAVEQLDTHSPTQVFPSISIVPLKKLGGPPRPEGGCIRLPCTGHSCAAEPAQVEGKEQHPVGALVSAPKETLWGSLASTQPVTMKPKAPQG